MNNTTDGMVFIPAGPFVMGAEDSGPFERPLHEVHLDDYFMDAKLVNNAQFRKFIDATGYVTDAEKQGHAWGFDGREYAKVEGLSWRRYADGDRVNHPVVLVSWHDAAAYAVWANKRLPTEAEWEKAARGGLCSAEYPWGKATPDGTQCNWQQVPRELPPTTPCGSFPANSYGLYDVVGNVWQWCADWYAQEAYQDSPRENPQGPSTGILRVRRGGAWNVVQAFRLRCANRGALDPSMAILNLGFRCAKTI